MDRVDEQKAYPLLRSSLDYRYIQYLRTIWLGRLVSLGAAAVPEMDSSYPSVWIEISVWARQGRAGQGRAGHMLNNK